MSKEVGWRPSKKPWDPEKPWEFDMMHPADNVPKELLAQAWGISVEEMAPSPEQLEERKWIEERQRRAKADD